MADLADIIARLEKATGPDRSLDGRIWAELDDRDVRVAYCGHWGLDGLLAKNRHGPRDECVVGVFDKSGKFLTVGQSNPPAEYTGSIDAAMTLVPEGWWVVLRLMKNAGAKRGYYHCDLERDGDIAGRDLADDEPEVLGAKNAHAPALAVCLAALRARASQSEEGEG